MTNKYISLENSIKKVIVEASQDTHRLSSMANVLADRNGSTDSSPKNVFLNRPAPIGTERREADDQNKQTLGNVVNTLATSPTEPRGPEYEGGPKKKKINLEHTIKNVVKEQNYKKKAVKEDFEFEMARNELRTAIDAAKRLMAHVDGEGELEAWVQSKITKASDYLDTVADYMDSGDKKKIKEHTEEIMEAVGIVGGEFKSLTIHGKVTEAKKVEKESGDDDSKKPSLADDAVEFAKDMTPGLGTWRSGERTKEAWDKGNYGQAALHGALTGLSAAGDVALASSIPTLGIGGLIGSGLKGAAATGARKLAAGAAEKAATTAAAETGAKAAGEAATKATAGAVEKAAGEAATKATAGEVAKEVSATKGTPIEHPSAPKVEPEPVTPSGGKKEPANTNLEPETKGTGTTGPAPQPKKVDPVEKPEPYKTGVEISKGPKEMGPGANANAPSVAPAAPKFTPELPGVKVGKPATAPKPANDLGVAPAAKPSIKVAPVAKPSAAPGAKPATKPAAEPAAKPSLAKVAKRAALAAAAAGIGNNLLGGGSGFSYQNMPQNISSTRNAQTYKSHADAPRQFREEKDKGEERKKIEYVARKDSADPKSSKSTLGRTGSVKTKIIDETLATVVKDVFKKKKQEKESGGQNPLVDFDPKLNHTIRNEEKKFESLSDVFVEFFKNK